MGGYMIGEYNTIVLTEYDAVIIGAGWAGLKAAQTLLDSGISSILILEANGYAGGRAVSINTDGPINSPGVVGSPNNLPTELGCEWLYITSGNMENDLRSNGVMPVEPAKKNDREKYSIDFYNAQYYAQTVSADGIHETKRIENISRLQTEIWGKFIKDKSSVKDKSYADAMENHKKKNTLKGKLPEQYLNLMNSIIEVEYAGDSSALSSTESIALRSHVHYMAVPGLGFGNIAGKYAEQFKSKIELNAKVTKIDYEDEQNNIITYVKDGKTKKVSTQAVLVTVPLGVLKAKTIEFVPSFPEWKQEAIDNMGFGVLNKCVMSWNNPGDAVWPVDKFWLELITLNEASSDKWTTFFNPTQLKKIPVLVGFIGGQAAIDAESQTDDEILDDVMKNLKSMYPTITKPNKVVITRWLKEDTARGSYAFKKVNRVWMEDIKNLQRKTKRLWFAGEATYRTPGTTTGAWNTGETAALAMASVLRNPILNPI
eukprot:CAMPEP_0172315264 /NCGR_PEP_ID=MMETSP1058-20130122/24644_1 /TAXON_ID=83371 /ORGANISM="Detonula confervacea, Strain CCMP 353" /LENGTH=484 /DNA_ID=CAMNT_0013029313 /DNA_START=270 /DNA_END=1724 /DNA_ORIENTATION=+